MRHIRHMNQKSIIWAVIALIVLCVVAFFVLPLDKRYAHITSFEKCSEAGYPILESYPEQCRVPDGRVFTREIGQTPPAFSTSTATSTPTQPVQGPALGKAITLRIGEKAIFSNGLTLVLKEISDSRCKAGVQCIWEGELSPVFLANGAEVRLGTVRTKSVTVNGYTYTLTNATVSSATIVVTKASASSGVTGKISVGPTCPVERIPRDPLCDDRPLVGAKVVARLKATMQVVRQAVSDQNGGFNLALPAGTYVIETTPADGGMFPTCGAVEVTVKSGAVSGVAVSCDSGIR
jgi:hypothetical protein